MLLAGQSPSVIELYLDSPSDVILVLGEFL